MRALIPPGLVELSGAEDAAAKFSAWFGDAEEFELMRSGRDAVADRVHVFYRLRVKKPGNVPKVVEQHLLCVLDADPNRQSRSRLHRLPPRCRRVLDHSQLTQHRQ